jgi:hypothetical protein
LGELQSVKPIGPMKKWMYGKSENEAQDFLTKMVNSPLFEERYNTMRGYKTPASKEEIDSVKDTMKYNIQNVDYWPVGFNPHNEKWNDSFNASAWYNADMNYPDSKYGINKVSKNFRNSDIGYIPHTIFRENDEPTLALHEASHASMNFGFPDNVDIPFSKDPLKQKAVKKYKSQYHRQGEEMKAYLDELRKHLYDENLYDATTKKFDEKDYDNLLKEYDRVKKELKKNPKDKKLKYIISTFRKFIEPYDKEQTIQAFNSFVDNSRSNELPIGKYGGNVSTEGYKSNSPDVNNPFNIIPSGNITMKGVDFPVRGVDNLGNEKIMYPEEEHYFPGSMVYETPVVQKGGGNKPYQVPGFKERMQYDKYGNKLKGYPSIIPKDMFAFMTPTERDPLSKNIKGVFGMGAYNFDKTPFGVEAGMFKNLDYLTDKGRNNVSITDANLTGTYNTGAGVKFKAGPNLTTIGLPDGRTIVEPATNIGADFNFPKLNLGINSNLTTDFNDRYKVRTSLNYRPNDQTSLYAEANLNDDFFKGRGTPEFRAGLTHNISGRKKMRPEDRQSGGEFQRLVKKYTTQGWSSLNPQEQQFYRETYQKGGSLPSYQIQGEKIDGNSDRLNLLNYKFDEQEFNYYRDKLESGRWNELSPKEQEFYRKNQPVMRPVQNKFGMEEMKIGDDLEWIPNIYKGVIPTINVTASRPDDVNPVINDMRTGRDNLQNEIGKAVEEGTPWGAIKRMYQNGPEYYYDAMNVALKDAATLNKIPRFGEYAKLLDVVEAAPVGGLVTQGLKAPIKLGTKAIAKQVKQIPGSIKALPKKIKKLDDAAGDYFFGEYARMKDIEKNTNKYLKEGLGIKKGVAQDKDIAVKYNPDRYSFETILKGGKGEKDKITGMIDIDDRVFQKPPSFVESIFGNKPSFSSQVSKEMDFPYQWAKELEGSGYGAEIVAAMNKAIKKRKGALYSSKAHLKPGITRYLQEHLKGRMLPGERFPKSVTNFLDELKKEVGNNPTKEAIEGFMDKNSWFVENVMKNIRWKYPMIGGALGTGGLSYDKEQKYQSGGSTDNKQFEIYQNYINGVFDEVSEEEAKQIYDKLNRIYYAEAKEKGMAPANYIMTHVIGSK